MTASLLSDEERLDWLRLIRSERVGPRTFRSLLARFGSAGAALSELPGLARRSGRGRVKIATRAEAEAELDKTARLGGLLIAAGEPSYPAPLLAIDDAPPLIAVRGSAEVLGRPIVAIVGSRNASAVGGAITARLAAELGEVGYAIASGLARGIDTRAHRGALATGTIAVLAGGLDRVYPAENKPLLEEIVASGGAVVTEMPLGWEPRAQDFPRRNRIVSGLSYGTVVIEAARRSGSLITARYALEQGREVFAVPGSPLDPRSEGTNDLIRSGAILCGVAEHVIEVIQPLLSRPFPAKSDTHGSGEPDGPRGVRDEGDPFYEEFNLPAETDDPEEIYPPGSTTSADLLLGLLALSPVSIDELTRQSGLPARDVQVALTDLELSGRVQRNNRQSVSLRPPDASPRPTSRSRRSDD